MKRNKLLTCVLMIVILLGMGVLPTFSKFVFADTGNDKDIAIEVIKTLNSKVKDKTLAELSYGSSTIYVDLSVNECSNKVNDISYKAINNEPLFIIVNGKKYICDGNAYIILEDSNGNKREAMLTSVENQTASIGMYSFTFNIPSDIDYNQIGDYTIKGFVAGTPVEYIEPDKNKDNGALSSLEKMMGMLLNAISNGLNAVVSNVLGRQLTIDDIVYNNYEETKLSYFEDSGTSVFIWGPNGDGVGGLHNTVNEWYSFFRKIAIIFYMIILVYMGIRILLASTGQGLEKIKELFMYWVMGIVILFFYPYVMKYTIELNNAFVEIIQNSQGTILNDIVRPSPATIGSISISTTEIEKMDISVNPFIGGTDYMAIISKSANETNRLAISLAYLILTWQLIILILHYYKRLFMTGFLIVIFPIVMIFYALDKIADGKSQGFDKWNKEFLLNVFVQSFHAIVYVFVVGTVYSVGIGEKYDYVLIIIGVTFLFTGEEIIKKIFSQDSQTITKSLGDTMAKAVAATAVVNRVGKSVAGKVAGANSIYSQTRNIIANVNTGRTKERLFDTMAAPLPRQNPATMNATSAQLNTIENNQNLSNEERATQRAEILRVGNAIATINNAENETSADLAKAYQVVKDAYAKDPNNAQLADLNMTHEQFGQLEGLNRQVAYMLADASVLAVVAQPGETRNVTIKRHIQAQLDAILEGNPDKDKLKSMYLANMSMYGTSRHLTRADTHRELDEAEEEMRELADSFVFGSKGKKGVNSNRTDTRNAWMYYAQRAIDSDEQFSGLDINSETENAELREAKELGKDIAIFLNRESGDFNAKQQLDALKNIRAKANSGSALAKKMIEQMEEDEEVDTEVALNVLAHKIANGDAGTMSSDRGLINKAVEIANDYDEHAREGYYDDEVSTEEVIAGMYDQSKRQQVEQNLINARGRTNQEEREITKQLATEILAEEGIDIENDGGELYLDGQTREDIRYDSINSFVNGVKGMTGFKQDFDIRYVANHDDYNAREALKKEDKAALRKVSTSYYEALKARNSRNNQDQ